MNLALLAMNAEDATTCLLTKGFKPMGQARQVPLACHLISLLLDGLAQPRTLAFKVPEHCQALRTKHRFTICPATLLTKHMHRISYWKEPPVHFCALPRSMTTQKHLVPVQDVR